MLKEMIESYRMTKTIRDSDLLIYVADDDPRLDDYRALFRIFGVNHIIGENRTLAKVYNYITGKVYPDCDYYQEINDDHLYRTSGWDKAFIDKIETEGKGWGIAFGDDRLGVDFNICRHPSGLIISGNIVRTLGYMVWPELDFRGVDSYYRDIGEGIGAFYRMMNITIEHRHWINGLRDKDSNFDAVNSAELCAKGQAVFNEWAKRRKHEDIDRLKKARGY
jgi:hypothetical protein